jgi:vacuolar-type H+-ATPase subunit H
MTDKQIRNFIERKYNIIKRNETKELIKQLEDNYDKKEHILKELKNKFLKDMDKICIKHNLVLPERSVLQFYTGSIVHEADKKIREEIGNIELKLDKEKLELIDEISILGIKDPTIKEKLSYLLNIKED